MRLLPTFLIILLTACLGTLVFIQQTQGNLNFLFGAKPLEAGDKLYHFDPDSVGRIEITNHDGTKATVIKKGAGWTLESPWKDYADPRRIHALTHFASKLHIQDVITPEKGDSLAEYGLQNDRISLKMFSIDGKPLCDFSIGRYTSWWAFDPEHETPPNETPPTFPTLIVQPNEKGQNKYLYACPDINDPTNRVESIRYLFAKNLRLFRAHQVFYNHPKFAAEITIKDSKSEITLKRSSYKPNTPWKLTKPFTLDTSPDAIKKLIEGLSGIEAREVLELNDIPLPEPTSENLSHTISIRYFLGENQISPPIHASVYKPIPEQKNLSPVIVQSKDGSKRPALLLVRTDPNSRFAALPMQVSSLRNRTLTSLNPKLVNQVQIEDFRGRTVKLKPEKDPHERIFRWHAQIYENNTSAEESVINYDGAVNDVQFDTLFRALFNDPIKAFTDDASTNPTIYGLDTPDRIIRIGMIDGSTTSYAIGAKLSPTYYIRLADNGTPLEVSPEAFKSALDGVPHPDLSKLTRNNSDTPISANDLVAFGLDRPASVEIDNKTYHLGKIVSPRYFTCRLDSNDKPTKHVVEISAATISKMPLQAFHWKDRRLWNINPVEFTGISLRKSGDAQLQLSYDFYSEVWGATKGPKNVTPLLNPHKADKLVKRLSNIKVHKWLGQFALTAEEKLTFPEMEIEVRLEQIDENGNRLPDLKQSLRISGVSENEIQHLYYGKSNSSPDYFLLEAATVESLKIDVLSD